MLTRGPGIALLNRPALSPIAALFANGADGLDFDFAKTDRLFQATNASPNADDPGEVIGFALESHAWGGRTFAQVLDAQPNLTPAGSWSMGVSGGTGTATESPSGTLNLTGDGTNAARGDQSFTTIVGQYYRLSFTPSSSSMRRSVGTSQGGTQNGDAGATLLGGVHTAYFIATATTTWVRLYNTTTTPMTASAITCKLVPGNHGLQTTNGFRPLFQTDGAKFGASDDRLVTGYLPASGANGIVALVTVPATISATGFIAGSAIAASNLRFYLGFSSAGLLVGGVGAQGTTTITGATDYRGQTIVVALSCDGTTVRLFAGTSEVYSGAQSGSVPTATALMIGALNNDGTAASFSGVAVKRLLVPRKALTLADYLRIRDQILRENP